MHNAGMEKRRVPVTMITTKLSIMGFVSMLAAVETIVAATLFFPPAVARGILQLNYELRLYETKLKARPERKRAP